MVHEVEKFLALTQCKTLEDILSNTKLNIMDDYLFIIQHPFDDRSLKIQFIQEIIQKGNKEVIKQNLRYLSINENWEIAEKIPEYKEIFFQNFELALENNSNFLGNALREIGKNLEVNEKIVANWQTIARKTADSEWNRVELISILNKTEEGKKVLNANVREVLIGNYSYGRVLKWILDEKLLTKEQITSVIVQDPIKMLDENLNTKKDFNISEYRLLLDIYERLLKNSKTIDSSKIENTRKKIELFIYQNFDILLSNSSIGLLKTLKKFDTQAHKISEKLANEYETISGSIEDSETMDFVHLYSDIDVAPIDIDLETIMNKTFSYIQDQYLQWCIFRITQELLEDQQISPFEMEIYGSGSFCKSIKIGEYILKIGKERQTESIPYSRRIIQPLIRRYIEGENKEKIFLEVQNLVDKDWNISLTEKEIEEELYKIYSEMRDQGIQWTDVKEDNVGRLLKPNSTQYNINNEEIVPFDCAVGVRMEEKRKEILEAGELVIIDTDFLYREDEKKSNAICSMHEQFEARYQAEQKSTPYGEMKPENQIGDER